MAVEIKYSDYFKKKRFGSASRGGTTKLPTSYRQFCCTGNWIEIENATQLRSPTVALPPPESPRGGTYENPSRTAIGTGRAVSCDVAL